MQIDEDKIDEAVLGLLWLTLHWSALNRLHRKGLIHDPVNRTKSVVLTDEGLRSAEVLFGKLFARQPQ